MAIALKLLGIAGSLRQASFNRGALRAAQQVAPPDAPVEIFDLQGIPVFNQDEDAHPPERVVQFKARIRAADALLIATPEYNYSIPGVLKNAIDWASRPYSDSAWNGKPMAILGASAGRLGTARAQNHLRQVCVALNMYPLNKPELMIPDADERFDARGDLTDDETRQRIAKLVAALATWTRQLQKARS
ncbi:NAD(P)H-dependent oxidoreductase [bacterium]|nr:NAD(P)H-dependent oxidoreductase [bacterium]